MSFPTKNAQTIPIPGTVQQIVMIDGSGNVIPTTYNVSLSGGYKYIAVSSATTTVISGVAGRLCRIIVLGSGGTLGNITIYDNPTVASGQVIFGPTTPSASQIIDLQIPVANGITMVTASATNCLVTFE